MHARVSSSSISFYRDHEHCDPGKEWNSMAIYTDASTTHPFSVLRFYALPVCGCKNGSGKNYE
jgi:hypothetical protein